MSYPLNVVIVEREGILKSLAIKEFKLDELYKKCGFKKGEDFIKQCEWNVKYDSKKYFIEVYGKTEGRANSENKYDFPPPIDTTLFFGSCVILTYVKQTNGSKTYTDLTLQLWNKLYEKLFGGFEDLSATAKEDEEEEDELAKIPKEKKTKQGYLKDGFVVDSEDADENDSQSSSEEEEFDEDEDSIVEKDNEEVDTNVTIEELGSELSEESYEYDSE
jgi:hypothetical protein